MSKTQQVGGTHYQAELQHWDVMEKHDIEYLLATASKYLLRHRKKGGLEDLKKSLSYVERKLEESTVIRRFAAPEDLRRLADLYSLDTIEREILMLLHNQTMGNLLRAKSCLENMIRRAETSIPSYDANDRQI